MLQEEEEGGGPLARLVPTEPYLAYRAVPLYHGAAATGLALAQGTDQTECMIAEFPGVE